MRNHLLLKVAASVLVLGSGTLGFAGGGAIFAATTISSKAAGQAARHAEKAQEALVKRDGIKAVLFAERAVAQSPRDARYRALLGQAYMTAGRFVAAETSFRDAIALDPNQARAGFNLALSQIALGKWEDARAMLAGLEGKVREADRGLAFALAGDPETAVGVLETAARAEGADAKTRQNLALAYAMSGDWERSRATAAQDLTPRDVFVRMTEWALFAKPKSAWDQVASLLGVTPVEDAGQPVALALAPEAQPQGEALAVAPAPVPVAAPVVESRPVPMHLAPAPVKVALVAPVVPVPVAEMAMNVPAPEPASEEQPVAVAEATSLPVEAPAVPVMLAAPAPVAAPVPEPVYVRPVAVAKPVLPPLVAAPKAKMVLATARPAAPRQSSKGRFVVQLGAYSTAARVSVAWDRAVGRHVRLASYTPSSVQFSHAGATVHRLAISGFSTRAEAVSLCMSLKAAGRQCFVRTAAGETPVQWVRRKTPTQFASR